MGRVRVRVENLRKRFVRCESSSTTPLPHPLPHSLHPIINLAIRFAEMARLTLTLTSPSPHSLHPIINQFSDSLKWLADTKFEVRRYAAVLILESLARTAPTLFYESKESFNEEVSGA